MSIEGHIEALKRKHQNIHKRIEALEAENAPEKYIAQLKKEKLMLKDEIARFENGKSVHL